MIVSPSPPDPDGENAFRPPAAEQVLLEAEAPPTVPRGRKFLNTFAWTFVLMALLVLSQVEPNTVWIFLMSLTFLLHLVVFCHINRHGYW